MNKSDGESAGVGEGRRHRRFPHLTAGDVETLNALPPRAARDFERLLRSQAAGDEVFHEHCIAESDLDKQTIEDAQGTTAARVTYGAGGGRRRPTRRPAP